MRLLTCLIILTFVCGSYIAAAEETSKGNYPLVGSSTHTTAIREHIHQYENTWRPAPFVPERRNPVGFGLDLILFEGCGAFEEFSIEGRYDFQNDEVSTYFVSRINLHKFFQ